MLNRRLIRVKVFQALYAFVQDDKQSLNKSKAYLKDSITGIHKNFITVLLFPLEMVHFIRTTQDPRENKYVVEEADVSRYEALCLHGLYEHLVKQDGFKLALERPPHNWQKDTELLRTIYRRLLEHPALEKLMAKDFSNFDNQVRFLTKVYTLLRESEEFDHAMEEVEMLWEDEKIPIFKSIRSIFEDLTIDAPVIVPSAGDKDIEGEEFAYELLTLSTRHMDTFGEMIDANSPGWDLDRIAKTDVMLMTLALTELMYFPYIPIKVTLNEYLELAKNYSTPQSSKFVNGVLDKVVKLLKADNKLVKKGRGMIE